MPLHEVISTHREQVIQRWGDHVRATLVPPAIPRAELVDHIPGFVSALIVALRQDAGLVSLGPDPEESDTAATHGHQRLRLGFSLDAVVREYGVLGDVIVAVAQSLGGEITIRELQIVSNGIVSGIAQAVSEYARQRDAEQSRQANEHFAFIAHELRNPLASAMISLQLLRKRGELTDADRAAAALERSIQRAMQILDQTLRVATVASGIELQPEPTSLQALCEEVQLEVMGEADAKNIQLHTSVQHDDRVQLDVRLVRSALSNLVRNAVKYTPSGRVVELRASLDRGRAVFEIADRCGGLAEGMVESAFAPFVRHADHEDGFGLGLAIAKQAADAHGGSIRVQNVPGTGCIFVLELPIVARDDDRA